MHKTVLKLNGHEYKLSAW